MKSTRTYDEVTARPILPKTHDWINELVERFGDDRVSAAITAEGPAGKFHYILSRVRDRLAKEDNEQRARRGPLELDAATLLATVRGQIAAPTEAFTHDWKGLTSEEYAEVIEWAAERQRAAVMR